MERPFQASNKPHIIIANIVKFTAEHAVQKLINPLQHIKILHKDKPRNLDPELTLLKIVAKQVRKNHALHKINKKVLRPSNKT